MFIKKSMLCGAALLFAVALSAQHDTSATGPEPAGGPNGLMLAYFKINFNETQRNALEGKELELIYSVSARGEAILEKINGTSDPVIMDSLKNATLRLPAFAPRRENGQAVPSLYWVRFTYLGYSAYQKSMVYGEYMRLQNAKRSDFEVLRMGNRRLDVGFGVLMNAFAGKARQHLGLGGGMSIDLSGTGKKNWGGGMFMDFYANRLKKPYPINSSREQIDTPPTLLVGINAHKYLGMSGVQRYMLRFDLGMAIHNVTPRLNDQDKDWIQFRGAVAGVGGHYFVDLGKGKTVVNQGRLALQLFQLDLRAGIRSIIYKEKSASGLMFELGAGFRLAYRYVEEYAFKK